MGTCAICLGEAEENHVCNPVNLPPKSKLTPMEPDEANAVVVECINACREVIKSKLAAKNLDDVRNFLLYGRIVSYLFTTHFRIGITLAKEQLEKAEKISKNV